MCIGGRRRGSDEQLVITLILVFLVFLVTFLPRMPVTPTQPPEEEATASFIPSDKLAIKLINKLSRDRPENYQHSTPWRQHGIIGRRSNGDALFQYGEDPGPIVDKDSELKEHGFNLRLSDSISLDRNVTDNRHSMCIDLPVDDYDTLPQTSVIFVFYNEAFSTLLRSIHSVLNRTPPQLLKEIILIDDGSDKEYLKQPLENYIAKLPKVRLVRQTSRQGLVKARLKGAEIATAETFTVLDSHIEVQDGWLPPLMRRMKDHPERVLMPMIDSVNAETFKMFKGGIGCTLGFLWSLTEHVIPTQPLDEERRTNDIDYIRSPVMAGGLFTVNRDFFWQLGGYDTDFSFWGTENLEISFRIWQCGGTLECSPCSRVYHIFRGHHPYSLPPNSVNHNKLRTAAIWMDEYGDIVKSALGNPTLEFGDISHMLALRKRLECKPFSWYMTEVYPTNPLSDIHELKALGEFKNIATEQCIDTMFHDRPGQPYGLFGCHGQGGSQAFVFIRSTKYISPVASLELCLLPSLKLGQCSDEAAWTFTSDNFLKSDFSGQCMTVDVSDGAKLAMGPCVSSDPNIHWHIGIRHEHPKQHLNPVKDANPVIEA